LRMAHLSKNQAIGRGGSETYFSRHTGGGT
jgi:hypothetical protein